MKPKSSHLRRNIHIHTQTPNTADIGDKVICDVFTDNYIRFDIVQHKTPTDILSLDLKAKEEKKVSNNKNTFNFICKAINLDWFSIGINILSTVF